MIVSAVVDEALVHCFAIVFRNLSFIRLFFQCVFVSTNRRMLYCWDLLLLYSSLREWESVSRSRSLVLINNNLVSLAFLSLGMSPKGTFLSSSIVFISLV